MQTKDVREKILSLMRDGSYAPMTSEELVDALGHDVNPNKFWDELLALEQNGEIIKTRFETYGLPEKMGLVAGRFQLTSKGFGFVIPDNKGDRPDVFIPPRALHGAMNNDRVLARVNNAAQGKKPEGEILRIITHANNKVVGVFHQTGDFAFVTPDDKRIGQDVYVMRKHFNGAKDGQKVVVEITEWPQEHRKAEGKVTEVLGNIGDVGLEILSIIKQNDLPLTFPDEVLEASRKVPKSIKKSELTGRRDLRERTVVTVDGEDAKDLDDAVYVEQINDNEYLPGVYIADVSYYVTEDSVLDKEAKERGTSVYLVDRVLPMLPERLSNGICSLNAGEDRLSMACEMHIDKMGKVLSYEIFPAVINVRHRLSYNIVRAILAGDKEMCDKYEDILPMIARMDILRQILHDKRARRGAVDFDLPEQKVILDEKLHPIEIVQRIHGNAESIIEEFMLAANETVAQHMFNQHWPFIYRVHDIPSEEKMQEFAKLLANFNIKFIPKEETEPKDIQQAVKEIAGRPEERLVTTVALRSMKQAVYQTDNIGHFGLAAKYYTHFTSPIRRYPDLVAHRMLQKALLGEEFTAADETMCEEAADQSTNREQAADNCERDIDKLYIASYMQQFIGEEFDAEVSGVQSFGVFVALENGCEGLIRAELMTGDFYQYDEEHMAMVGRHTGKRFTIGTPMRVKLLAASDTTGQIDFAPADGSLPVSEKLDRPRREDTDRAPRGNRAERRRHSGKGRGGKPGKGKKPPTRKRR